MTRFMAADPADHIKDAQDVEAYINAWLEDGTAQEIAAALGTVARSEGMSDLARKTGISRVGLYNALSDHGNPSLDTALKVLRALGFRMRVEADPSAEAALV